MHQWQFHQVDHCRPAARGSSSCTCKRHTQIRQWKGLRATNGLEMPLKPFNKESVPKSQQPILSHQKCERLLVSLVLVCRDDEFQWTWNSGTNKPMVDLCTWLQWASLQCTVFHSENGCDQGFTFDMNMCGNLEDTHDLPLHLQFHFH